MVFGSIVGSDEYAPPRSNRRASTRVQVSSPCTPRVANLISLRFSFRGHIVAYPSRLLGQVRVSWFRSIVVSFRRCSQLLQGRS